jgi:hypothetical protein
MNKIIVAIVVLLPLILSLWKVGKSNIAKNTLDFFLANRKIDSKDFINTTVSYSYQVASISLFASWGYFYGFWTIWVPMFWGLGFYLLEWLNNTGRLDIFYENHHGNTLHGFLRDQFRSPNLGKLAAIASVLGLSGTAFFEAEFTSNIISHAVFPNNSHIWFLILFFFFVGIVLAYILWGGLKTIVITNKAQLSFGFIFFNLFSVYLFDKILLNHFIYTALILYCFAFLSIVSLNILYPKLHKLYPNNFSSIYSRTLITTLFIYIIGFIVVSFQIKGLIPVDSLGFFLKEQQFSNVFSLGGLSMISLLLANGLWQIVDVSTWQRLAAVNEEKVTKKEISKTLRFIGWYSAITWIIAILFGMGLKYVGLQLGDASTALQNFTSISLLNGTWVDKIFILILFMSMIFIAFSTIDSIISVISYTAYYDLISLKQRTLKGARFWTIAYTVIFLIIYYIVRQEVSTIDSILYTFYSFQLALFPLIISVLLNKKMTNKASYLSILFGFIGTSIPLFINTAIINPYTSAAIFSIGLSSISLIVLNLLTKKKIES